MDARALVESLGSNVCPYCGRAKRPKMTFCPKCYYALTPDLRETLYRRLGAGYEEAVAAAMAFLKSGAVDVPPTGKSDPGQSEVEKPKPLQGELFGPPSARPSSFRG